MTAKIPPVVERMLARHAILADEHKDEFLDLFSVICGDEDPQTTVEWFLVFDITCEVWELLRLRGLKARVLHAELLRALVQEVNVGYVNHINANEPKPPWLAQFRRLFVGVLAGDPAAKLRMEKFLEPEGLTLESLLASAFWRKIETQVSADRLVESAYQRRNALYADLERVRSKAQRTGNLPPTVESPSVAEGDEQSAPAKHEDRVEDVAGEGPRGGQS